MKSELDKEYEDLRSRIDEFENFDIVKSKKFGLLAVYMSCGIIDHVTLVASVDDLHMAIADECEYIDYIKHGNDE